MISIRTLILLLAVAAPFRSGGPNVGVIARVRNLAVTIARRWVDQQRGELPGEEVHDTVATRKVKKTAEVTPTTA